jgi:hypothetical protein
MVNTIPRARLAESTVDLNDHALLHVSMIDLEATNVIAVADVIRSISSNVTSFQRYYRAVLNPSLLDEEDPEGDLKSCFVDEGTLHWNEVAHSTLRRSLEEGRALLEGGAIGSNLQNVLRPIVENAEGLYALLEKVKVGE